MTDTLISIDIEASGPIPGEYSMLSLGACLVYDHAASFYVELKPINWNFDPEALRISGLDMEELMRTGAEPADAMARLENWIERVTPAGSRPVFVGYPVAFDWMFVAYYFHRFLGHNPFGYAGLDVKSYYLGVTGKDWGESNRAAMSEVMNYQERLTHNALEDARVQAELFARLTADRQANGAKST